MTNKGKKNITITDVAESAGVSISTVSRYLSNHDSINQVSAVKIAKAIDELHYIPNLLARNLKTNSTNMIGFITSDISQEFQNQIIKVLNELLFEYNYFLITCDSDYSPAKERKQINSLLQQNCALIVVASCGNNNSFLNEIAEKTNKLVLFDRDEDNVKCDCICEDNINNAKKLTQYMIDRGHKKFIVFTGPAYSTITLRRLKGIREALNENNIELLESDIHQNFTKTSEIKNFTCELLKSGKLTKDDTIIFTNPKCVNGIIRACWKTDKTVNEDFFVAGFTTTNIKKLYNAIMPCIIQDADFIGNSLGKYILDRLKAGNSYPINSNKKILIDSNIVENDVD